MRTVSDLDGGTFDVPDIVVLPADWDESLDRYWQDVGENRGDAEMTIRLLESIQDRMRIMSGKVNGIIDTNLWNRLTRAEAYLVQRHNRDEATLKEQEAFDVIWPPIETGGEA